MKGVVAVESVGRRVSSASVVHEASTSGVGISPESAEQRTVTPCALETASVAAAPLGESDTLESNLPCSHRAMRRLTVELKDCGDNEPNRSGLYTFGRRCQTREAVSTSDRDGVCSEDIKTEASVHTDVSINMPSISVVQTTASGETSGTGFVEEFEYEWKETWPCGKPDVEPSPLSNRSLQITSRVEEPQHETDAPSHTPSSPEYSWAPKPPRPTSLYASRPPKPTDQRQQSSPPLAQAAVYFPETLRRPALYQPEASTREVSYCTEPIRQTTVCAPGSPRQPPFLPSDYSRQTIPRPAQPSLQPKTYVPDPSGRTVLYPAQSPHEAFVYPSHRLISSTSGGPRQTTVPAEPYRQSSAYTADHIMHSSYKPCDPAWQSTLHAVEPSRQITVHKGQPSGTTTAWSGQATSEASAYATPPYSHEYRQIPEAPLHYTTIYPRPCPEGYGRLWPTHLYAGQPLDYAVHTATSSQCGDPPSSTVNHPRSVTETHPDRRYSPSMQTMSYIPWRSSTPYPFHRSQSAQFPSLAPQVPKKDWTYSSPSRYEPPTSFQRGNTVSPADDQATRSRPETYNLPSVTCGTYAQAGDHNSTRVPATQQWLTPTHSPMEYTQTAGGSPFVTVPCKSTSTSPPLRRTTSIPTGVARQVPRGSSVDWQACAQEGPCSRDHSVCIRSKRTVQFLPR